MATKTRSLNPSLSDVIPDGMYYIIPRCNMNNVEIYFSDFSATSVKTNQN